MKHNENTLLVCTARLAVFVIKKLVLFGSFQSSKFVCQSQHLGIRQPPLNGLNSPLHSHNCIVDNSLQRNQWTSNGFVFLAQLSAAIYNRPLRKGVDNAALSRWFLLHRHLIHLHILQKKRKRKKVRVSRMLDAQSAILQKKQRGGVCFGLYSIVHWQLIQQTLTPPEMIFRVFAHWMCS